MQHYRGIPKDRILLSYEPRGKNHQKFHGWNYKVDFVYSDDFFKTRIPIVHKGNKFLLTEYYLYVAQVVDVEDQEVLLQVAKIKGKSYNFQTVEFPSKRLSEHSYTFLDTGDSSVFLNVNHFKEHSYFGDIYISDNDGDNFSLSLRHNLKNTEGQSEFEKVSGIYGIYMANAFDEEFIKHNILEIEKEELEKENAISQDSNSESNKKTRNIKTELDKYIKTFITFNKGGSWHRLKAPDRDFEGKQFECDVCYLNLHGTGSKFNPFYSIESAPGIIIGSGNVGEFVSQEQEHIGVFVSRDAGLTWAEVRRGSYIYEIGDHGALIVMAEDINKTNTLLYSWDEGISWQEHKFSDVKIKIDNIIIEPDSLSQKFIIYGEAMNKGVSQSVLISVDFTNLHEPQCRNPNMPDNEQSDYESWYPSNSTKKQCLLGRKIMYVRRKQQAKCYNGERFERRALIENCECTNEDYECDRGYSLNADGTSCVAVGIIDEMEANKPPANCDSYYKVSRGYRRIPGDYCVNGINYDPILIPCPYSPIYSALKYLLYLVILLGILYAIFSLFNSDALDYLKSFAGEEKQVAIVGGYDSVDGGEDNTLFDNDEIHTSKV